MSTTLILTPPYSEFKKRQKANRVAQEKAEKNVRI